ncbi:2Fe-2S iron-sulfur cluster-binding protein [Asticcacaulis sp. AND118]|uniref:2Fe-2S iron-sulfur cluster-binding protein n=1 Tax=Asticcacaulis sp. AND118 TaxID=2840468 RepID=UPI001CFF9CD0|nr:2Fe-2S iron-sulfur cluster-binding protein [Asticcacaulis sp. AND118]UDF04394.1 2Fe-2S iron-sulfur cluster binding domain-containing protein [Asticcacaulis sp. AND118]
MSDDELHILCTDRDGVQHTLPAIQGWRIMEIIRDNGLPIKAECGGALECATCHVYVDSQWWDKLIEKTDEEEEKLDEAFLVKRHSRLSCQILMRDDLNGLEVTLAPEG